MFLVIIFLLSIVFLSVYKEGFESSLISLPTGFFRINDSTMIALPDGIDFSKVKYMDIPNDGILPFEHIEIPKKPNSNSRVMVNIKELSESDQTKIVNAIQSTIKPITPVIQNTQDSADKLILVKESKETKKESKPNDFRENKTPSLFESRIIDTASIFPGNNSGFCSQPSSYEINQTCNGLSKNICASTSCCVLLGDRCVAGSARGPTNPESYQGNKDSFYYFQGQCYGNC